MDTLGIPWEEVHEDACLLEHALSPRVQEALERFLENPAECPHGHPIPAADGTVADRAGEPLSEQATACEAAVLRVEDEDEDLLTYLASLGMFPGTTVKVCDVAPFKGPMMVEVGGSRYALGRDIADKIVVEPRRRREGRRG